MDVRTANRFSSVDAAERLREALVAAGYDVTADDVRVIATGYGRVAVPYAHKVVTEITCHGTGCRAPVWRPRHRDRRGRSGHQGHPT